MKKVLTFLILTTIISCFACYIDNPSNYLKQETYVTIAPYYSPTGKTLQQQPVTTVNFTTVSTEVKSMTNETSSSSVKVIAGVSYRVKVSLTQTQKLITKTTTTTNLKTNQVTEKKETFDAAKYGVWNNQIYKITTRQPMPLTIQSQFSGFGQGQKITRACLLYLNKNGKWIIIQDLKNPKHALVSNDGNTKIPFGHNCIKQTYGYKPGEILYILIYFESQNFSTHNLKTLLIQKTTNPSKVQGAIAIGIIENVRPK